MKPEPIIEPYSFHLKPYFSEGYYTVKITLNRIEDGYENLIGTEIVQWLDDLPKAKVHLKLIDTINLMSWRAGIRVDQQESITSFRSDVKEVQDLLGKSGH